MRTPRISLRAKLTGAFLVPTLLILVLFGTVTYLSSRQGLEDELGKRLISIAQTTSSTISEGVDAKQLVRLTPDKTRVRTRIREKLMRIRESTDVGRVFVFDESNRSLVDTEESIEFGDSLYSLEADRVELKRLFDSGSGVTSVLFKGQDEALYKTGYAPVFLDGKVVAAVGVEASASYFALLTDFVTVLSVLGLFGVFLILLVAGFSSQRITRPVNELVAAAQRLGGGDYSTVVTIDGAGNTDEIGFLGEAFEEMRQDIVGRDQQLQMMLSGIAHEVRNPLGGMRLFVGLLDEDLADDPDPSKREKVQKIERELEYLDRVVTDFLDYARKQKPELERFSGREFAEEIAELLGAEVSQSGSALVVDVEESVEVTADRAKLRQAVINCVRNSYQACESGRIELTIEAEGMKRLISIVDDGPGIPKEQLDDVMSPFFTTKEKGSGLGLSLVRRVSDDHDGTLEVLSAEGQGCRVILGLPFHDYVEKQVDSVPEGWLG